MSHALSPQAHVDVKPLLKEKEPGVVEADHMTLGMDVRGAIAWDNLMNCPCGPGYIELFSLGRFKTEPKV